MEQRTAVFKIVAPNAVLLLSALMICGWLWYWSVDPVNLPITNVKISNSYQNVTQDELQSVINPYLKYGFMTVPLPELRAALQQLTWVDQVAVRRIWPATLEVKITEQQAVARWGYGGVLNADGVLFHPEEHSIPPNLPMMMGPSDLNQSIFQHYQMLQALLKPSHLNISSVQVSPRHSWQIQLDNHIVVVLGSRDHRVRLQRLIEAMPHLQKRMKGKIHQVDLRYPNGLAVS